MSEFDEVLKPELYQYITDFSSPESELLYNLYRETNLNVIGARMLSGAVQGKFLEMISKMIRPQRILELGTYTGYSAINLAMGLVPEGKLSTIEINPELFSIAQKYIQKSPKASQIEQIIGNAIDIIPSFADEEFDLIFLDADKENYLHYYETLIPKLKIGGWMLIDNVLWSGKVWQKKYQDTSSIILRTLNDVIIKDPRVENVIIPMRDGMSLIQKIN